MKKTLLLAALLFSAAATHLSAQVCTPAQSQIDLHGNNIKARILNNGSLFWDGQNAQFIPNPDANGDGPATIFTADLWMGGVDPGGNLKVSAVTYTAQGSGAFAGPLNPFTGMTTAGDCANWDRHFLVRGDRVRAFLDSLPLLQGDPALALAQYPEIMGWPGQGNAHFADVWGFDLPATNQGLAPFLDANANGMYDPLDGDYPVVWLRNFPAFLPAEIVWCVFNDEGAGATTGSFNMEFQLTAWAFDCPDQPVLNNTVFTSHKLINRAVEQIDSFYLGMWVDFDLGCYTDDYIGTDSALNAFYAYNQDAVDGTTGTACNGTPTFGTNPPVQSATLLNVSMDQAIYYNNASVGNPPAGTTDPGAAIEYYNYLTGHWRDGTPITAGGSGYQSGGAPTNYVFPDDPADPNGWSMCTANLPAADRRMLAGHKVGVLHPGDVTEFDMAWTVHPNPTLPCGLGNTFDEIATVRSLFDNHFGGVCSPVTATQAPLSKAAVMLTPNPATDAVLLQYGNLPVLEVRCFDASGRMVRAVQTLPATQYLLDVAGWKAGVYTLELLTKAGIVMRQLVVLR